MSKLDRIRHVNALQRCLTNLSRARNLVSPPVDVPEVVVNGIDMRSDMIRAGVLLAHATLEEVLRTIAVIRLPHASPDILKTIPLAGAKDPRKPAFHLGDLAAFRSESVETVIRDSVVAWQERSNYNNVAEVIQLLSAASMPGSSVQNHEANLAALMSRRHLIAHRADHRDAGGGLNPIDRDEVLGWIDSVEAVGVQMLVDLGATLGGEEVNP